MTSALLIVIVCMSLPGSDDPPDCMQAVEAAETMHACVTELAPIYRAALVATVEEMPQLVYEIRQFECVADEGA